MSTRVAPNERERPPEKVRLSTQVLIIGGGATGAGIARDLALRGVQIVLVERRDFNSGASGANHGLLHSGARYVSSDPEAARECRIEGELLKRLAPHCIEDTGGLFVAVKGDDEKYLSEFETLCRQCGIPAEPVAVSDALEMEPALSDQLIAAFQVPDAAVDPFRLTLENIDEARRRGAVILRHTVLERFAIDGRRIRRAYLRNMLTGDEITVEADQFVSATGAWATEVAQMANISVKMLYSKGTLLVTQNRLAQRIINRLRKPSDADILVPGGTVSIIGTTSTRIDNLSHICPTVREADVIVDEGCRMIPTLETTRYIRAYAGVRPLPDFAGQTDGREISRGFVLLDHENDGLENFVTITGGKLTTYRLMAEKTSNLVCRRMGVTAPCVTHQEPLPATAQGQWTEPGFAPRVWVKQNDAKDLLLCECEMVPQSAINQIIDDLREEYNVPRLPVIGLRSRVGKGPCQGTFCSLRITGHLYEQNMLSDHQGLAYLQDFIGERWKGQRPVLWGQQLAQAELMEALHCGLLGLEQADNGMGVED